MLRVILRSALLMAGGVFSVSCFGQNDVTCPKTVRMSAATLDSGDVPTGYEVVVSKNLVRLTGINAFNGPPEEGATLVPKAERSSRNASTATWKFEGDYRRGKFVSCDYAQGLMRVVTRIGDSINTCTGTTRLTKPYNTLSASFDCR